MAIMKKMFLRVATGELAAMFCTSYFGQTIEVITDRVVSCTTATCTSFIFGLW